MSRFGTNISWSKHHYQYYSKILNTVDILAIDNISLVTVAEFSALNANIISDSIDTRIEWQTNEVMTVLEVFWKSVS